MFKALLKKQFLELNAFYFRDKKTGKNRSKAGVVMMFVLFAMIFVFLGVAVMGMAFALAAALLPTSMSWLYFALMGMMAVLLGVFGSVFNTYAGLYHAKDNELLLAMPIPPRTILLVRMLGVYAMSMLYESIVMIPTVLVYWILTGPTLTTVLFPILLIFLVGFLVLTLTCFFGWIVALISSKLKNKSFLTVLFSLIFLGVYYAFYFNLSNMLTAIVENIAVVGETLHNAAYPFYLLGRAAEGDGLAMLAFSALVLLLLALTVWILSRSFLRIATRKESGARAVYREKKAKAADADAALFRKELKRFASSSNYMLNCGLSTVLMPTAAIAVWFVRDTLLEILQELMISPDFIGVLIAAAVVFLSSMNNVTAPSVSLEGAQVWLLQSLPVRPNQVFAAKRKLHLVLTLPPALFMAVSLCILVGTDGWTGAMIVALSTAFIWFIADAGLVINLLCPNLTWTNETVPVKQSLSVFICLFGAWVIGMALAGIGFVATVLLPAWSYLGLCAMVFAAAAALLEWWLRSVGARKFARL